MKKLAVTLFIVLFAAVETVLPYSIPGGATHTFTRGVNPGVATVQIRGDGSTNLDLYIYYGNALIGRAESPGDSETVQVPTRGGAITILVVNRGRYVNNYQTNFWINSGLGVGNNKTKSQDHNKSRLGFSRMILTTFWL